jgi:hypothetical protein
MIYAIGDSFTYGGELSDRSQAWPTVLQTLLGKEVINWGREGCGNTRIVKRIIDATAESTDLIIVGWTDPSRLEFADDLGIYNVWPGRRHNWNYDHQKHRRDLIKSMVFNDVPKYYYANWLRQVILIQNLCKSQNVRCLMFIAFYINQLHKQYSGEFQNLLKQINLELFVDYTLNESTSEWTYSTPKMPGAHPGPEGHKLIANKIYEHIRNLGWIS